MVKNCSLAEVLGAPTLKKPCGQLPGNLKGLIDTRTGTKHEKDNHNRKKVDDDKRYDDEILRVDDEERMFDRDDEFDQVLGDDGVLVNGNEENEDEGEDED